MVDCLQKLLLSSALFRQRLRWGRDWWWRPRIVRAIGAERHVYNTLWAAGNRSKLALVGLIAVPSWRQFQYQLAAAIYLVLLNIYYIRSTTYRIYKKKKQHIGFAYSIIGKTDFLVLFLTFSIPRIPNNWLWYSARRQGSTVLTTCSIVAAATIEGR